MDQWRVKVERIPEDRRGTIPTDPATLGFGRRFSDHRFVCRYNPQQGWHNPTIEANDALSLNAATMVLHYGQEVFEGLKAYQGRDGQCFLFRWQRNAERLQRSCQRLKMQAPPVELFEAGLKALLEIDRAWVPPFEGCSLYLRPVVMATDPFLGVRPSDEYLFYIIASPVGAYYPEGFNPVRIYVEEEDVRAVRGGLGEAKTGANYAASLRAQVKAKKMGYTQVLWLDAIERRYVEEVGTSNAFFVIDGEVVTPPLGGTILAGITRDSVLTLLRDWGIPTAERPLTIDELLDAARDGRLSEGFGTGTAAVISPIGVLGYRGEDIQINQGRTGDIARRLYATLTGIQYGYEADPHGWIDTLN